MLSLLRVLLPLFNVAALVLVARRRRLLRRLRAAKADAADRAIPLEESGLSAWWLKRLTAAGVVRQTTSGQYWLDAAAYSSYRRERMIRVTVVLGVALLVWVVSTQR
jgi:hypothetical protein